jgi:hypothetical protein
MSLIHDALRKAAEENARREGRPLPLARHEMPSATPPAATRGRGWLRAAAFGVVALAITVAFWPTRPVAPPAAQPPSSDTRLAPVETASDPVPDKRLAPVETASNPVPDKRLAPVETASDPVPDKRLAPVETASNPVPDKRLAPVETAPVAPTPIEPPQVETTPAAPVPSPDVPAGRQPPRIIQTPAVQGQVAQDTYVLHAEIDGQRLDLDFIVWSEEPFAQVNGRQVAVGQQVDGFVVIAISREQITLEKPGRQVRLRIR